MNIIAIIPARGGSKSIPRKNIKELCGKPLIAYAIEGALKSAFIDRVIVSTDDKEIATVARHYGAEVPFMRPSELASDLTQDKPVFEHAINWLEDNESYNVEIMVNLRPTAPLRTVEDIDGAIEAFRSSGADFLKSVCISKNHPHKMWIITGEASMEPFASGEIWSEYGPDIPRQKAPDVYWQNGVVDILNKKAVFWDEAYDALKFCHYIMPQNKSIDLDTEDDLEYAEFIMKKLSLPEAGGLEREHGQ